MDAREMELLLTPVPMSEAEKEFRAWIKKCKTILEGRNAVEVAELAICVGFDRGVVYSTLSTFQDAMNGTHVDKRFTMHMVGFTAAVKQVQQMKLDLERPKVLDLSPLWADVHAYQTGEVL